MYTVHFFILILYHTSSSFVTGSEKRGHFAQIPNFGFKRLITSSGNRTPGSRFYSDLLDTSVCIHVLVLKRRQSARLPV